MPVPGGRLKGEMMSRREVTLERSSPDHRQYECTDRHVHAVKSGQHINCGTVYSRRHLEVQCLVGMNVFFGLQEYEDKTQDECHDQEYFQDGASAGDQRMVPQPSVSHCW